MYLILFAATKTIAINNIPIALARKEKTPVKKGFEISSSIDIKKTPVPININRFKLNIEMYSI